MMTIGTVTIAQKNIIARRGAFGAASSASGHMIQAYVKRKLETAKDVDRNGCHPAIGLSRPPNVVASPSETKARYR